MGLFKYFKEAFLYHWNLLVFAGGLGFAALSGHPDIAVPLVLAGESAYLGLLASNPRFQRHVDAQEARVDREQNTAQAVDRLLHELPEAKVRRFQALRRRCLDLREIARQMRASQGIDSVSTLDELQRDDLDRLLWTYLRMLYTQSMLERFLESTRSDQLEAEVHRLERKIADAARDPSTPASQRILTTLQEGLETAKARLENRQRAQENAELLSVEIESLEAKIQSITELAINRHDPEYISGQVDQIVRGLVRTEQTMNDLESVTGGQSFNTSVPKILVDQIEPDANADPGETSRRTRTTGRGMRRN